MAQKNIKINKKYLLRVLCLVLVFGTLVVWSPQADAKIEVEGDREFTDDVNECISRYRNTQGLVGDAIRELENSDNTHKITEGPDWENSVNSQENAFNGKGTGTVTEVSKEELEKLKKKIKELENKDFCTALLHELWHAVDADRGQWSNEKYNNVWQDEVEATMFQNFIHSLRGVPVRTKYGGKDISGRLGIFNDENKKEENEPKKEAKISMSYSHVKPGEYSEVYLEVVSKPGEEIEATLTGPGVSDTPTKKQTTNKDGIAKITWKIVSYGSYEAKGKVGANEFSEKVIVQ